MTPTIDNALHRIRSWFATSGMNTHQVAVAAKVHWTAAAKVLEPGALPSLESAKRVEALVPSDFVAPAPHADEDGVSADSASVAARGSGVLCNHPEGFGQ